MLRFFREAIRITEKVGHSLPCLVLVNKQKYFCMPFGVLFVFRTQICFSHASAVSICTFFFFQKRGSEKKSFPQSMNQSGIVSPQMLELLKALMLRSFCFQNDYVSTKVRLFFSTRHFLFTKNRRKHCPQL